MDQSHFKMYFTTHNSCTYTLASSSLEAQPTETVGDRECYHLMLLYAYRISMFFCSWLLRGTCWGIFLQLKWDWKISSCSGWIIVGNNLTHWVFVWGYCCLRVLLLKALCNILRCPQTQTDWQINFCLQIFDRPFHEGVYWKYSDFLNNYLKQTDADLNEICKTSFQHTVSQTCITAQFPPYSFAFRSYLEESRQGEVQRATGPAERMTAHISEFLLVKGTCFSHSPLGCYSSPSEKAQASICSSADTKVDFCYLASGM